MLVSGPQWRIIISGLAPFLLGTNHFVSPCPLFTNLTSFSLTATTPIRPPIRFQNHLSYRDTFRCVPLALRHPLLIGWNYNHLIFLGIADDGLGVFTSLHFLDLTQIHLAQFDNSVINGRTQVFVFSIGNWGACCQRAYRLR